MDIAVTTILLFAVFGVLLFLGCPISVSIVVSSIVTALSSLSWDQITFITMQKMNGGVESFSLLAVPLFILAGNIMNNGGIARRLVNFAKLFCGWIPGSLAQANVLGNMLFGALSGSAVAASSAMGGCIYPIQKEEGYDPLTEWSPVDPAQHYFMGGIWVDKNSKTSMEHLYAVGETSCNGVHGRNRLASNSLLESMVFAKRAAQSIMLELAEEEGR